MFRNILSNWGSLLITVVLSLVLTPLLIHRLGPFYFGLWILVVGIAENYGLLEFGMRTALFRFAARHHGTGDRAALNQTVVSALTTAIGIGLVVLLLTAPLVVVLPGFFHIPLKDQATFRWVLVILGLSTALTFPARMMGTYLSSLQRFDLYSLGDISVSILRLLGIAMVLWLGLSIVGVGLVTLLCTVALMLLFIVFAYHVDPQLELRSRHFQWEKVRELACFSMFVFLASMGDYLRFSTDSVVISRVLGVALVTPFSIPARMVRYFQSGIVALGAPINARLNALDAQHKTDELRDLFLRATRLTFAVSGWLGVLMLVNGGDLIRLWVGDMPLAYPVLTILVIGYVAELSQHPACLLMLARSQHRMLAAFTILEGVANLILSVCWAPRFGLLGVAMGTAVPMVVARMFVLPWFALRTVDMHPGKYLDQALLRPVLVTSASWLICSTVHQATVHTSFLAVGGQMAWQTLLFAALFYAFACRAGDHALLRGKLDSVRRRLGDSWMRASVAR